MVEPVRVRVPAKINLALCVGPERGDGYHNLGTIFHAISLVDEIRAQSEATGQVTVRVKGEGAHQMPEENANLAVRAAKLLRQVHGHQGLGVELKITKQIPVAGGLAGGSADAAGALLACSVLWDLDTAPEDLRLLAAELGSDVAFPLIGGNAVGTGRGEQLMPMLARGCYHWVLAFAHQGLSTPAVFRRFDELGLGGGTELPDRVVEAVSAGDAARLGPLLRNDLQDAALDLRPELGDTLERGLRAGALGGIVSGSGPTCAFLAASESEAMDVAAVLSKAPTVRMVRRAMGPAPGARLLG